MTTSGTNLQEEAFWKNQFDYLRQEPVIWALDADALRRSFELVSRQNEDDEKGKTDQLQSHLDWQRRKDGGPEPRLAEVPNLRGNAMMLGALAVEVMLKGIAVSSPSVRAGIAAADKSLGRRLWSHNLRDIASLANVQLSTEEVDLCARLETALQWSGRYSTPKNHREMMPRSLPSGAPHVGYSTDFDAVRALADRLRGLLPPLDYGNVEVILPDA